MTHICEIIAVGTELLLGNIANTDAQDISQGLAEIGVHCYFHTTVGDNPERLRSALRIAKSRADIIITTGGLGPTYDDLTKQTVCAEFGVPLVLHEPTWRRIQEFFERVGRPVTQNNAQQAMLPEGGVILENSWGTAPGCGFEAGGVRVYMLPGPPRECLPMFRSCLMPHLRGLSDKTLVSRNIRIFGLGESAVEDKLRDIMESASNPTLAPYAKEGEVLLRVTASAATEEEAHALAEPMVARVCEIMGDVVYSTDGSTLEETVLRLLVERGLRLAVAESCTGGLIADRITGVPGASKSFMGGVVAYFTSVKTNLLGVPAALMERYGVVSPEVSSAMAQGVCKATGAELGLGVTGLAGPLGDGSDTPVGTVCITLHDARTGTDTTVTRNFGDSRHRVRIMASGTAIDMVRQLTML